MGNKTPAKAQKPARKEPETDKDLKVPAVKPAAPAKPEPARVKPRPPAPSMVSMEDADAEEAAAEGQGGEDAPEKKSRTVGVRRRINNEESVSSLFIE